jgi:hypothetical protein
MWGTKEKVSMPNFSTRAEAFAYMLQLQLADGVEPMAASKKADEFAEVFARNMQLPEYVEPEPQGLDKALATIDKVSEWIDAHPKAVELVVPTITFIAGLFTAKATTSSPPPIIHHDPIDFNNVE